MFPNPRHSGSPRTTGCDLIGNGGVFADIVKTQSYGLRLAPNSKASAFLKVGCREEEEEDHVTMEVQTGETQPEAEGPREPHRAGRAPGGARHCHHSDFGLPAFSSQSLSICGRLFQQPCERNAAPLYSGPPGRVELLPHHIGIALSLGLVRAAVATEQHSLVKGQSRK